MSMSVSTLTANFTTAAGASSNTASVTTQTGSLLLLTVGAADSGGAPVAPTSVTGGSLTWTRVDDVSRGNVDCTVWRASGSSFTGAVTINWGSGTDTGIWQLDEFTGVDTTTNQGVVQHATSNANSATATSPTLSATVAGNATFFACIHNDNNGTAVTYNRTAIGTDQIETTAPVMHRAVQWDNPGAGSSPATSATFTYGAAANYGIVALEIDSGDLLPTGVASTTAVGSPSLSLELDPAGFANTSHVGYPFISTATGLYPDLFVEFAWPNNWNDPDGDLVWTDVSDYVRQVNIQTPSRADVDIDQFKPGYGSVVLDNRDGRFTPNYSGSPYFPYVRPNKRIRIRACHNAVTADLFTGFVNTYRRRPVLDGDEYVEVGFDDGTRLLALYRFPDSWGQVVQSLTPTAWYRLAEQSGTVAVDNQGVRNGTYSGSPTFGATALVPGADADVSRAVTFDSTDLATVSSSPLPSGTTTSSIVFRAKSSAYSSSGGSSLTVSKPSGVQSGDVMVAFVVIRGDKSVSSAPSGWTDLGNETTGSTNNDCKEHAYWKVVGASEPSTYKWTFSSGGDSAIGIVAYSGVDNASPIDVSGSTHTSTQTDTTCSAPSVTTAGANRMLVTGHAFNPATTSTAVCSQSPPSGMTERVDTATQAPGDGTATRATVEVNELVVASAGATGVKTSTLQNSQDGANVGWSVALKPSGSGSSSVTTPHTIVFWLSQTADQTTTADNYVEQGTSVLIFQETSGTKFLKYSLGNGAGVLHSGVAVPSNTACLVVARFDGNLTMKLDTSSNLGTSGTTTALSSPVTVADGSFIFGRAQATLDEVTVFDRYLTDAEVATLTALTAGGDLSSTVISDALDKIGWDANSRTIRTTGAVTVTNVAGGAVVGDPAISFMRDKVSKTERGALYFAGDGKVTFETRSFLTTDSSRTTVAATFGSGGIGYFEYVPDYNDFLYNSVQVKNTTTDDGASASYQELYTGRDEDSISEFGEVVLELETIYDSALSTRVTEIQSRIDFELNQYAQPVERVRSIRVQPKTGADWDTLLALALLSRVTVNFTAASGAAESKDYTIRGIKYDFNASPKTVVMEIALDDGGI